MQRTHKPRRPGTVLGILALFLALAGTGWAASHGGVVKIRCTATRNGRPIACRVVSGSGVGPRGPRGPRGFPGSSGAAGPTTLTSPEAYVLQPGATVAINAQYSDPTEEWQRANLYAFNTVTSPETAVWRTYLLSPSRLNGSAAHLDSVQFCYGLQDSTSGGRPAQVSISHVAVSEFTEAPGLLPSQPVPAYTDQVLLDQPLSLTGTNAGYSACQTVAPSTPPLIAPGGFLIMDLTASFVAPTAPPSGNVGPYQGWVYLGRVSVTYGP